MFDRAVELFQRNRLAEAEEIVRGILEREPDHCQSLHLLGVIVSQCGNPTEGLKLIEAALRIAPDSAPLYNSRGNVLVSLKRFDEALASFEKAIALNPSFALALNNRGNLYRQLGRFDDAVASYDNALRLDPNDAETFYNRGGALEELRRFDEAVASYDKAIALRRDYAEAFSNRGAALQGLGRLSEAVTSYNKAIALKANFPEALCSRGTVFHKMQRFDEAIASYDQAIALKPDFAEAFNYRGLSYQELARFPQALASYDEAIALKPDYAEPFSNRGHVLRMLGKLDQAIDSFERANTLAPRDTSNLFNLATSKRITVEDPHFAAMKGLAVETDSFDIEDQIRLHFALGKAFADIEDWKQSSHHFLTGNFLKRQHVNYDEAQQLALFNRICTTFTPELTNGKHGLGDPSASPVFIVGMPRSGTTLVEQILASHSRVFGAGELQEFGKLARSLKVHHLEFPEAVPSISDEQLGTIGGRYLRDIRRMAPSAQRITDKMPTNFLYLGLIHLALPNARIIHVMRDARDTALSCFSILFTKGQLEFTYDLGELGRYLRGYQTLMEHWRKVLPPEVMLELQYEKLINDFEPEAKLIAAHCGLPWDEACLAFHKTDRIVRTASVAQVRQPLYRSSIGRWRNYQDLLKPVLEELKSCSQLLQVAGHTNI